MNMVHLHLMLNHAPVIGLAFGAILLAAALLRASDELTKSSLWFFVLLAAASALVFATGGAAEDTAESLPGVSGSMIEHHEEAALVATILVGLLGALSLGILAKWRRRSVPRVAGVAMLIGALGAGGAMGYVANLGGQIRHTEIRSGARAGEVTSTSTALPSAHLP